MLRDAGFSLSYETTDGSLTDEFLSPALENSILYRRASGYFSSSALALVVPQLVGFIRRGGRIKLICSPALNLNDLEAIAASEDPEKYAENLAEQNYQKLVSEEKFSSSSDILSFLLVNKFLEIKFCIIKNADVENAIFHEKFGIFTDSSGDSISFSGSINETRHGWGARGNGESFSVFHSWKEESDKLRLRRHSARFEGIWDNQYEYYRAVAPTPEFLNLVKGRLKSGNAAWASLSEKYDRLIARDAVKAKGGKKPLPLERHQSAIINSWVSNGYKGIVQFCTGAGKTFVGLEAININATLGYPSLVLVPSELLFRQWVSEITHWVPAALLEKVGLGNNRWRDVRGFRRLLSSASEARPVVIVATLDSFCKKEFVTLLGGATKFAIVADEVHQCGATVASAALEKLVPQTVIGLSATPERFGDPEGTRFIFDFFGPILKPTISLGDAISLGRLVGYQYFPTIATLTSEEAVRWKKLTSQIGRLYASARHGDSDKLKLAELKVHERARIAKKASAKVDIAADILRQNYRPGDRWLVYCEDIEHINDVGRVLAGSRIPIIHYHSKMAPEEKAAALEWLSHNDGVVLSVKCLDEGVDIPAVDSALIIASSQNPRQFIQRRGRVLRFVKGKQSARIYDVLILPAVEENCDSFEKLLQSEVLRCVEFCHDADNSSSALARIETRLAQLGIRISDLLEADQEYER